MTSGMLLSKTNLFVKQVILIIKVNNNLLFLHQIFKPQDVQNTSIHIAEINKLHSAT